MDGETETITTTITEVPAATQEIALAESVEDSAERIERTAEEWQQQFSVGVSAMLELVTEVRAANSENSTLRGLVSELLTTVRSLTEQLTLQSATATQAASSTLAALTPQPTPTPHSDDSQTASQESDQSPVTSEPAATVQPTSEKLAEVHKPKHRRI